MAKPRTVLTCSSLRTGRRGAAPANTPLSFWEVPSDGKHREPAGPAPPLLRAALHRTAGLTCRVPDGDVVRSPLLQVEGTADGADRLLEALLHVAVQQGGLAHVHVPQQHHLPVRLLHRGRACRLPPAPFPRAPAGPLRPEAAGRGPPSPGSENFGGSAGAAADAIRPRLRLLLSPGPAPLLPPPSAGARGRGRGRRGGRSSATPPTPPRPCASALPGGAGRCVPVAPLLPRGKGGAGGLPRSRFPRGCGAAAGPR